MTASGHCRRSNIRMGRHTLRARDLAGEFMCAAGADVLVDLHPSGSRSAALPGAGVVGPCGVVPGGPARSMAA
jgi:hypothetical protein